MTEIVVTEHTLNKYRKQVGLTLWKIKRLLESEFNVTTSEAKISRQMTGVDTIPEHIEEALTNLFKIYITGILTPIPNHIFKALQENVIANKATQTGESK